MANENFYELGDFIFLRVSYTGTTPAKAYEQLEDALVKTQNPDEIDAVSGATGTSEGFKALAKEALKDYK
ncbi:FMN-binding protein [Wansuia hejianensis]|uniref:FMN-binding protein n=1 Tax=Wansuia hejianensis TaxID=2763667 RepID=A0A926EVD6_9FIRM|nr:FMN-binding protein [Wansuia hejianensis]MBC8589616.1 FMN-binding protein [Wansuia hejianensis]